MRVISRPVVLAAVCMLIAGSATARAQDVTVAAASDLQTSLPGLIAQFERETARRVRVTFGSSGNFFAQIQNGAPFDVFLSADVTYPERLQDAGLTEPGTLTRYANGRLALWTRTDSGVDVRGGLGMLRDGRVKRIAIANPDHAPYGRAALEALRRAGIYEDVRGRFLMGENIAQAAQFAESGNADVAIIALSLAQGPALKAVGTYVVIPASMHPPIEQGAVVLKGAKNKTAARQFLAYLGQPHAADYLAERGFEVPRR
jgi:molybdate transport system substrate-binding protein